MPFSAKFLFGPCPISIESHSVRSIFLYGKSCPFHRANQWTVLFWQAEFGAVSLCRPNTRPVRPEPWMIAPMRQWPHTYATQPCATSLPSARRLSLTMPSPAVAPAEGCVGDETLAQPSDSLSDSRSIAPADIQVCFLAEPGCALMPFAHSYKGLWVQEAAPTALRHALMSWYCTPHKLRVEPAASVRHCLTWLGQQT